MKHYMDIVNNRPDSKDILGYFSQKTQEIYGYKDFLVCPKGNIYSCPHYGHSELYDFLKKVFNLKKKGFIHISSGYLTDLDSSYLEYIHDYDTIPDNCSITLEQLFSLWRVRKNIKNELISDCIRHAYCLMLNYGSKYGNLMFLANFYDFIPIPKVSSDYRKYDSIRTSPITSKAGYFDSIFNIDKNDIDSYIENQRIKGKCFFFSQEYVKGVSGFLNCNNGEFEYSIGDNINKSINKSTLTLNNTVENYLFIIANQLYKDFCIDFQLEFVSDGTNLVIVQFRTFYKDIISFSDYPVGISICRNLYRPIKNTIFSTEKNTIIPTQENFENVSLPAGTEIVIIDSNMNTFSHLIAYCRQNNIAVAICENAQDTLLKLINNNLSFTTKNVSIL